jgi:formylmethanofuran dehydrogenase subunit E
MVEHNGSKRFAVQEHEILDKLKLLKSFLPYTKQYPHKINCTKCGREVAIYYGRDGVSERLCRECIFKTIGY